MRRIVLGLALLSVVVLVPSAPAAAAARPNVLVVMTDDQRLDDMRAMPRTRRLLGDGGHDVRARARLLSAVLPVAGDVPHRPVQPQPRRHVELRAVRRLREVPPGRAQLAAGLAAAGRVHDRADRQVPQRVRRARPAPGPAGLVGLAGHDRPEHLPLLRLLDERQRPDREGRAHGRADYMTDAFAPARADVHPPPAAPRASRGSCGSRRTRRTPRATPAAPRGRPPSPRGATPAATRTRRCRGRRASTRRT